MKALLTTATTILFLLGGADLAQAQEHEHGPGPGPGGQTRPMMEDGGMSDRMLARCRMTMGAELSPRDPAVLLGMKGPLELTDEQVELDAEAQAALDQIAASYLTVQQRLAGDAVEGVTAQLTAQHDAAHALFKADSAEEVVQIALLNNRGLQATCEDLMIAQADLATAEELRRNGVSASAPPPAAGGQDTGQHGGHGSHGH